MATIQSQRPEQTPQTLRDRTQERGRPGHDVVGPLGLPAPCAVPGEPGTEGPLSRVLAWPRLVPDQAALRDAGLRADLRRCAEAAPRRPALSRACLYRADCLAVLLQRRQPGLQQLQCLSRDDDQGLFPAPGPTHRRDRGGGGRHGRGVRLRHADDGGLYPGAGPDGAGRACSTRVEPPEPAALAAAPADLDSGRRPVRGVQERASSRCRHDPLDRDAGVDVHSTRYLSYILYS